MPVMPGITTSENTTSKRPEFADQFFQRMGGVADHGGVVAELGERIAGELSDLVIVLDDEHRDAVAVGRRRFLGARLQRPLDGGDARQVQREPAAAADLAVHHHLAAGLLGEAEHLRQAEPGALADFLGGEERLENAPELILRNPAAGILHRTAT